MSIGSFSYTRSGLVSLARSQFRRSSDVTSPFPPSGNEGYIRNRDVSSFADIQVIHNENHSLLGAFICVLFYQPNHLHDCTVLFLDTHVTTGC